MRRGHREPFSRTEYDNRQIAWKLAAPWRRKAVARYGISLACAVESDVVDKRAWLTCGNALLHFRHVASAACAAAASRRKGCCAPQAA